MARAWGDANVRQGDEVLITVMEHHSNIVPWQQLCARTGAALKAVPIDDRGQLVMDEFERLLSPRTKMVAVAHLSNALGTINPVAEITARAKAAGAAVLIDGSQAAHHMAVDVQALGADFYVLTGHKMYGPTGIGVLHGREAVLDAMPPFLGGGDMIRTVAIEGSTWNDLPYKFEAGTPAHRRRRSVWARRSITCGRSGSMRSARTRRACWRGPRPRSRRCRACGSSARRRASRAWCRS